MAFVKEQVEFASKAWEQVRGDDPPFNQTALSHREKLVEHARSVIETGTASEDDSQIGAFERAVLALVNQPEPQEVVSAEPPIEAPVFVEEAKPEPQEVVVEDIPEVKPKKGKGK